MARHFFDTSALVKLHHDEVGSDRLDELLGSRDRSVVSAIARIEFLSALFRKVRTQELKVETVEKVIASFLLDWRRFEVVPISEEFLRRFDVDEGVRGNSRTEAPG